MRGRSDQCANANCQNATDGDRELGSSILFHFLASDAGSGGKPVGDVRSPSDPTTLSSKLPLSLPSKSASGPRSMRATRPWDGRAQLNTATDNVQQPIS